MKRSKITAITLQANPFAKLTVTRNYDSPRFYYLNTWKRRDRAERLFNTLPHRVGIMDLSRPYYVYVQWERIP
jgi:hypothetical protein